MSSTSATMPFPARLRTELKLDPVLLTLALTLMLGGLVMLASASITIADKDAGDPFFYVERQLVAAAIGAACCTRGAAGAALCCEPGTTVQAVRRADAANRETRLLMSVIMPSLGEISAKEQG